MDAETKQIDESTMFGGSPARILRLSAAGRRALAELRAGPVESVAAGVLARRLTDVGLAHPCPPPADGPPHVTVVIPVRDRPVLLDRCLAGLGGQYPVIVVDDGSVDRVAVAQVAARHGAKLIARASNGGAGPARNTGLAEIQADPSVHVIAFVDSDCVPSPDWIPRLAAHFADPQVGAVAPRIVAPPATGGPDAGAGRSNGTASGAGTSSRTGPAARPRTAAARYAAACGSLDLGDRAARVAPGTRVSYVPTAALLVRREALDDLRRLAATDAAEDAGPFDPGLRHGEDVDLVWRLQQAGWRIRYDPSVQMIHRGPETWTGLLGRRFRYGTSAGPLATRHPANLAPLVLQPWPAAAAVALLARRPLIGAAAVAGYWLSLSATLRRADVPTDGTLAASIGGTRQMWLGIGRYATQFAVPAVALGLARPGGRRPMTRWGRRAALASLLLGPALTAYRQVRPGLDPVTFTMAHIADDVSYGAGVWASCIAERTATPLRPALLWRPLRFSTADAPASGGPAAGRVATAAYPAYGGQADTTAPS